MKLVAATRGSPLALWQTQHVATLLKPLGVDVEPLIVLTSGCLLYTSDAADE